jgi:hypothetical protein
MVVRDGDLDLLPGVTTLPDSMDEDETLDIPVAFDLDRLAGIPMCGLNWPSLPSYVGSASTSQSSPNLSPLVEHELIWPEGSPQTSYARRVQRLDCLYPSVQKHISSIIELGDNFLREDVVTFLKSFCRRWSKTKTCNRPALRSVAGNNSRMKSLLSGYYHAEAFKCRSVVDRLKLRFLRILLYHDFEELCIEIQNDVTNYGLLPGGQNIASVATSKILDEFSRAYTWDGNTQISEQRRQSFRRHKLIGRRWSILASHLGLGIFLTCSSELETRL